MSEITNEKHDKPITEDNPLAALSAGVREITGGQCLFEAFTKLSSVPDQPPWKWIGQFYQSDRLSDRLMGTIMNGVLTTGKLEILLARSIAEGWGNADPNLNIPKNIKSRDWNRALAQLCGSDTPLLTLIEDNKGKGRRTAKKYRVVFKPFLDMLPSGPSNGPSKGPVITIMEPVGRIMYSDYENVNNEVETKKNTNESATECGLQTTEQPPLVVTPESDKDFHYKVELFYIDVCDDKLPEFLKWFDYNLKKSATFHQLEYRSKLTALYTHLAAQGKAPMWLRGRLGGSTPEAWVKALGPRKAANELGYWLDQYLDGSK